MLNGVDLNKVLALAKKVTERKMKMSDAIRKLTYKYEHMDEDLKAIKQWRENNREFYVRVQDALKKVNMNASADKSKKSPYQLMVGILPIFFYGFIALNLLSDTGEEVDLSQLDGTWTQTFLQALGQDTDENRRYWLTAEMPESGQVVWVSLVIVLIAMALAINLRRRSRSEQGQEQSAPTPQESRQGNDITAELAALVQSMETRRMQRRRLGVRLRF